MTYLPTIKSHIFQEAAHFCQYSGVGTTQNSSNLQYTPQNNALNLLCTKTHVGATQFA